MRRIGVVTCVFLSMLAGSAEAQQPPPPPPGQPPVGPLTLNRNNTGAAEAEAARGKARAGDCEGALALFDAAVKAGSHDPLVFRDRAICHDRLGNAFPAVEDYRAYLAMAADAPDRQQVEQRIEQLQSKTTNDNIIVNQAPPENLAGQTSRDVYASSREAPERKRSYNAKPGEPTYLFDYYKEQERLEDRADRSPLRYGTGLVIAPIFGVPRLMFLGKEHSGIAYTAGAQLRYSVGRIGSVILELTWGGIGRIRLFKERQSTYATNHSGPMGMLGFEWRLRAQRQTRYNDDQYWLRAGVGYERYVDGDSRAYLNMVTGRFAVGFRHVFMESLGFDFGFDGGPVLGITEGGTAKLGGAVMSTFGLAFGL